jgi:hypothetical protein
LSRRLGNSQSIQEGSSCSIPIWIIIVTGKETKKQNLASTKKGKNYKCKDSSQQNYESKASKFLTSEVLGAEGSHGASLLVEVLKESSSSTRFLFLSRPGSSETAGEGDEVELLSSREISASSPSWQSSALGASEAAEAGST